MRSLDASPQFGAYSGVEMIVDDDTSIFAGDRTGRVLTVRNPWGTQAQANYLVSVLRGLQYQPYAAQDALLSPAAELGDAITAGAIYGGIYKLSRQHSPLMAANIEAPEDEEIDHEYPYESKVDRVYQRELAQTRAQISVTATAITAEVTRATAAEGSLGTRITQTQNSITAEVTRATAAEGTLRASIQANATSITAKVSKTGGQASSFAWSLTDSSWTLTAGNKTVLKATASGIEVSGKITATSGYIGNGSSGFTITARAIYNGVTGMSDTSHTGVYVGTDGIVCGKGAFKVTNAGAVTATNLVINGGSINLGNGAFKVTNAGAVTATNLTITGGSIRIGSNFAVTSTGDVTANNLTVNGTLRGNVEAANARFNGGRYTNASYQGGFTGSGTFTGSSLSGSFTGNGMLDENSGVSVGGGYYNIRDGILKAYSGAQRAEEAMTQANAAIGYFSGLTVAPNMLITQARIGALYIAARWCGLTRRSVTIDGVTYNLVGWT